MTEAIKAYLDFYWWHADVNCGQRTMILKAKTASEAAYLASAEWRHDATEKQRKRGIYDLRVRHAKFGEVRNG